MKIKVFLSGVVLTLLLNAPFSLVVRADEPTEDQRRQEAIEYIQDALDEDPEEAAKILGSTPVADLNLESLEELGDKAFQFVRQKEFERQQDLREERTRLKELQDIQNSLRR